MADTKKAWSVCMAAWFAGVALACVQNKVTPIISTLIQDFHVSMSVAGWLSSVFAVMCILIALPAASIMQKIGAKWTGVLALAISSAGTLLGLMTHDVSILMLSRVIEGFGVGIIVVVGPSLISMWFPPERRGLPMGIWTTFMILSQSLLFLIADPIVARWGWQGIWIFSLVFSLLAILVFIWKVEEPPAVTRQAAVGGPSVSIWEGMRNSNAAWLLAVSAMFFAVTSFGFVSWISPYWSQVNHWSMSVTENWVSLLYSLELVYAVVIGLVLNKVVNRKGLGLIGYGIYALLALACFTATRSSTIILLIFIFPIFDTLAACISWTLAPQAASKPEYTNLSISILNIGLNTGTLLGAPVIGWVIEKQGSMAGGWALAASALLAMLFLALTRLNKPRL